MPRYSRQYGGFTLVEILVVVVILGIASAVIIPQIGSRDDLKTRSAARTVMADLIYAQNMSIAHQKAHYVRFDTVAGSYSIHDAAPLTTANRITHPIKKDPYTVRFGSGGLRGLESVQIKQAVFDGTTADCKNQVTLLFDELGTPHVINDVNVVELLQEGSLVLASGNFELTITVEAFTGEIKVQ